MALDLQGIITAARDRHPLFTRDRVPHAVLARFFTGYQRRLISQLCAVDPDLLAQQASIVFADADANTVGIAGAGTPGGLPAQLQSGLPHAVQLPAGSALEMDFTEAPVLVPERPVTSAASTTLNDSTQAWTTNQYQAKFVHITAGTGQGQRREIASNTATQLVVAAWTTIPDTTSLYEIVDAQVELDEEMGVVTDLQPTSTRLGYLVRLNANGTAYVDLTQPLVAKFDVGIDLPPMEHLIGGTVRPVDEATQPLVQLRLIEYSQRLLRNWDAPHTGTVPTYAFSAWLQSGKLFLGGIADDWKNVASIDLRYVPIAPEFTALTDLFLLPEPAYDALVAHGALVCARRVAGLAEYADRIDVAQFATEADDCEMVYIESRSRDAQRPRVHYIRDVF